MARLAHNQKTRDVQLTPPQPTQEEIPLGFFISLILRRFNVFVISDLLTFFKVDSSDKSAEEVRKLMKRSYRKMVLATHPDRGGDVEEFRKVQDLYEQFLDAYRGPAPQRRAVVTLFEMFCQNAAEGFTVRNMQSWCNDAYDLGWFSHFAHLAHGADFFRLQSDVYTLHFFPEGITLPRLYRAYAIRNMDREDKTFQMIERMFIRDVPWNYDWLKTALRR